ncbi:MAG: hypothetical protein OXD36_18120 [Rhodobacter sp.]|nr:hypothetical protein [Rhodobacter sp.]
MNKYGICLRTDDSHCLEADRFEFREGCLVFERTNDPFPLVAVCWINP